MKEKESVTVYDLARAAGVSQGTVDRVLHNRGRFSEATRDKVLRAVEELGYAPNMYARSMAQRSKRIIACIVPDFEEGTYWDSNNDGLMEGAAEVAPLGVEVRFHRYDYTSRKSFKKAVEETLDEGCNGVILGPVFDDLSLPFVGRLREMNIPFVYIDRKIGNDGDVAFYGTDFYQSGILGAHVTSLVQQEGTVLLVALSQIEPSFADTTVDRRQAIFDYFSEHCPGITTYSVEIDTENEAVREKTLDAFFAEHPEVRSAIVTNTRAYQFDEYLRKHPKKNLFVLGYDDTRRNLKALRDGNVSAIITRGIPLQAKNSVISLANFIQGDRRPETKDNYLHLGILTKHNLHGLF